MKRLLLLSVILIAAAAALSATPLCSDAVTLADLIADGAGGCSSQGVIFSNFSFTSFGTFSGANQTGTLASQVAVSLFTDNSGPYQDNWLFSVNTGTPLHPVRGTFKASFDLSYTVSVATGNPFGVVALIQSTDVMNTGSAANGDVLNDTQTGVTPSPIQLKGCSGCSENQASQPYLLTTLKTSTVFTFPTTGGKGLQQFEQDFSSTAPEPVTFLLIGSGLIGLAFLRRRSLKG